jgi:hypothetical protein
MIVEKNPAYTWPPHYIFYFVKEVMLKLKSLITYDVIFEYFYALLIFW